MDASSVVDLWQGFERRGFEVCIDGGWAVDALLGRQTRPHEDLDIALPHSRVPALTRYLHALGFTPCARDDTWEHNFVLSDARGRAVDVHSYVIDAAGRNIGGVPYIPDHLTGRGRILDVEVRCIAPAWLVAFHTGYPIDETDYHDVRLLCDRFGIALPAEYARFLPEKQ